MLRSFFAKVLKSCSFYPKFLKAFLASRNGVFRPVQSKNLFGGLCSLRCFHLYSTYSNHQVQPKIRFIFFSSDFCMQIFSSLDNVVGILCNIVWVRHWVTCSSSWETLGLTVHSKAVYMVFPLTLGIGVNTYVNGLLLLHVPYLSIYSAHLFSIFCHPKKPNALYSWARIIHGLKPGPWKFDNWLDIGFRWEIMVYLARILFVSTLHVWFWFCVPRRFKKCIVFCAYGTYPSSFFADDFLIKRTYTTSPLFSKIIVHYCMGYWVFQDKHNLHVCLLNVFMLKFQHLKCTKLESKSIQT